MSADLNACPSRPTAGLAGRGERSADELAAALARHGLILRGGFHPKPGEAGLEGAGTLLLVGNAGGALWDAFEPHLDRAPDPLNRWTTRVIEPIAEEFGARALYPFGEPHWPFQRWALRAETLYPSPLGLLIHPEYGLWHAWRAALLFAERLRLPPRSPASSPCASCADKPCLSACPVGAFSGAFYDVPSCGAHLASGDSSCGEVGCHARKCLPGGPRLALSGGADPLPHGGVQTLRLFAEPGAVEVWLSRNVPGGLRLRRRR